MAVDLDRLAKLIALAEAPPSGSDEEAKSAAMAACALIRQHSLHIYDASVKSKPTPTDAVDIRTPLQRAHDENPVIREMRRRREDRIQREQVRRREDSKRVG